MQGCIFLKIENMGFSGKKKDFEKDCKKVVKVYKILEN